MGTLVRIGAATPWGPAEQAALDRCLAMPGLSELAPPSRRSSGLSRMIEAEIIPRLMLAHLPQADQAAGARRSEISAAEVADFTRMTLERDTEALLAHVAGLERTGLSLAAVFLDLLAPTARLLGDMWRDDLCSFAEVTIGMSRLQQVLRELDFRFEPDRPQPNRGRALLAAVPGDQHVFGVLMLESFFRQAGWEISDGGGVASGAELVDAVRREHVDLVGLSLSSDIFFGKLASLVRAIRTNSKNRSIYVMVGGRYFLDHPHRAGEVGADAAASDAPDALRLADAQLGRRPVLC